VTARCDGTMGIGGTGGGVNTGASTFGVNGVVGTLGMGFRRAVSGVMMAVVSLDGGVCGTWSWPSSAAPRSITMATGEPGSLFVSWSLTLAATAAALSFCAERRVVLRATLLALVRRPDVGNGKRPRPHVAAVDEFEEVLEGRAELR